ncbi:uncharacterized protein C1orf87 homolog [Rhinatrema bivittatum]|uniref:uncharacterized protein C1orf87 homolog n=1 Tax=Rhinatrema bivittatum TaxID=194408 RepID=UPI00112ACB72|nr:uncharacterized protein C1orf87 homolog [Rhinatrema bivittatum]
MDIPFGTDATPEIIVKIIGSKYVQYVVEKPEIKAKQWVKNDTQAEQVPSIKRQMGQSSVDPLCKEIKNKQGYEEQDKGVEHKFTQVFKGPNIQCITAPSGDQTLSFIHVKNLPIDYHQSRQQAEMLPGEQQDVSQRPPSPASEADSLFSAVKKELQLRPFSLKAIDDLQAEITTQDPVLSGFLPRWQINHLFLKHQFPLHSPTVKLLLERFNGTNDPELVNYEKLLEFLRLSLSSKIQISKTIASGLPVDSQTLMDPPKNFSTKDEGASWILKQVLKEQEGLLDIEKIKLAFQTNDRASSGLLPHGEIEAICQKHGLLVPHSLFEAVLNSNNLNERGKIRWHNFVELLNKAQADANSLLLIPARKEKRNPHSAGVLCEDPDTKEAEERFTEIPTSAAKTSGGKPRRATQPVFQPTSNSEEQEAWIDRFRKVEKALQLCDTRNTGMVDKERAKRLLQNYNMIFDLRLSPLKIDQAIRDFHSGETVMLRPMLQYLKEL